MKVAIYDVTSDLADAGRLALCGGLALYFAGNALFRLRLVDTVANTQLVGVLGATAVFALGGNLSTVWVTALATAVVAVVCVLEAPGAGAQTRPGPPPRELPGDREVVAGARAVAGAARGVVAPEALHGVLLAVVAR